MQSVVVEFGKEAYSFIEALSNSLCDVATKQEEAAHSASHNIARKEILLCSYTGFCLANQHGICTDTSFCNCQRKTSSVA